MEGSKDVHMRVHAEYILAGYVEEQSEYILFTACLTFQLHVISVISHHYFFVYSMNFVCYLMSLEQNLSASLKPMETLPKSYCCII